ncbi:MAG: CIA30 family protein [Maribacter sp.]
MQFILQISGIFLVMNMIIFDFNTDTAIDDWRVVNDGVMGGRSQSRFSINEAGHGFFQGTVSLANNGGFASVRYRFQTIDATPYSKVSIRLRGDGNTYQFRVKATTEQRYSHIANFTTSGEWQTVTIDFSDMYPAFRGRLLELPNYSGSTLSEIAFLIGNKKEESFALEIDNIMIYN